MSGSRSRSICSILIAAVCVLLPAAAFAQQFRATVTGTVVDAQGAVVPGATVTALNTDTNVSTEAITNEKGAYALQQLAPGPYRITAGLSGFKTFVRDGVTLHTAETITVNVTLSVGAVEERVTVSAQTSNIESNETTISQTIENKRIPELPLNGRQVYMLLQLTPGTLFTQTTFGATGLSGRRPWHGNGRLSI